jgi:hypothetical protein
MHFCSIGVPNTASGKFGTVRINGVGNFLKIILQATSGMVYSRESIFDNDYFREFKAKIAQRHLSNRFTQKKSKNRAHCHVPLTTTVDVGSVLVQKRKFPCKVYEVELIYF